MSTVISIIVVIAALFIGLQLFMRVKMILKKGKSAPEVDGKAGRMVNNGDKVLFYFYSPGCRACIPMTPVIKNLAKKNRNVFPVDVSKDMSTAQKFGVMGTPSTVVIEAGKIKEFLVGFQTEDKVRGLLA
jgi:thioredoxin 1